MSLTRRKLAKCWCFTLNNPTSPLSFNEETMQYMIWQKEEGEGGTPHYQGYIQMKAQKLLTGMKKVFGNEVHWEVARGTLEENQRYCTKVEGRIEGPWEKGEASKKGERNDLAVIAEELRKRPLAEVFEDHPEEAIRYGKGMRYFRSVVLGGERGNETRVPEILVYWGDSGAGKSMRARLMDPDLYNVPVHEGGVTWFDGYDGQETILFDDFCGGMKYSQMLRFCDIYPLQVQTKGGFVNLNHKRIIITSNKPPETWYCHTVQCPAEALLRRIYEFGNVIKFTRLELNGIVLVTDENYPRKPVPAPLLLN